MCWLSLFSPKSSHARGCFPDGWFTQEPASHSCHAIDGKLRPEKGCSELWRWGRRMEETDTVIAEQRMALQEMRSGASATWESTTPAREGGGGEQSRVKMSCPLARSWKQAPGSCRPLRLLAFFLTHQHIPPSQMRAKLQNEITSSVHWAQWG